MALLGNMTRFLVLAVVLMGMVVSMLEIDYIQPDAYRARESRKYFAHTISIMLEDDVVVFGSLHGELHTFLRDCTETSSTDKVNVHLMDLMTCSILYKFANDADKPSSRAEDMPNIYWQRMVREILHSTDISSFLEQNNLIAYGYMTEFRLLTNFFQFPFIIADSSRKETFSCEFLPMAIRCIYPLRIPIQSQPLLSNV